MPTSAARSAAVTTAAATNAATATTAATAADDARPPATRRERQRRATFAEIVEVARRLLRESDDVSLRAVAAEMGLTPPALYRYVDSHAELMSLVARSVFADVVAAMTTARDRHPDDDPAAQIVAAATAFRGWALGNREEFRLVFASPLAPGHPLAEPSPGPGELVNLHPCAPTDNGVDLFAGFFSEIFARVWERYRFPVPADDTLDPAVLAVLSEQAAGAGGKLGFEAPSAGMIWLFERAWARLYGIVTLEVFGHLHPDFIASGAMFAATMREIGSDLALTDDWPRLQSIARDAG